MSTPRCCHPECSAVAAFAITDEFDYDPGTCTTEACDSHVGALLGHATHVSKDVPDRWVVTALETA